MGLGRLDFHDAFDNILASVDAQSPLVVDDPRKQIFQWYTPTVGGTALDFKVSSTCWLNTGDFMRYMRYVCWHDAAPVTAGSNCVAITPRHVIMGEHGHEPEYQWLTWMSRDGFDPQYSAGVGNNITRWGGVAQPPGGASVYKIESRQIVDQQDDNAKEAFRVTYIDGNVPRPLICPLLNPTAIDAVERQLLTNIPFFFVNQFNEAIVSTTTENPSGAGNELRGRNPADVGGSPPGVESAEKLRRSKLYRPVQPGDSGSPAFYAIGRGMSAKIYYAGSISARNTEGPEGHWGPSALACYNNIIEACRILNGRHANRYGAPHYLPAT